MKPGATTRLVASTRPLVIGKPDRPIFEMALERLGCRALQESTRLFVNSFAKEVVFGGVANVELDRGIEFS